ncbi:ATP-dependent zinc protease family protein [Planctomicrobium sp. SH527]|uniref:ATP-dependent zinc protease family protein n=1 Tax=Planctomicrobium sp. SH527 TaxID=3448123 RepID=UPI003F5B6EEA
MRSPPDQLKVIGWREWVSLPALGVDAIKAKIDTGATTSSLHAFEIERFRRKRMDYVRFRIHPKQLNNQLVVAAEAPLIEMRTVRSSNGHESERPVIRTLLQIFEEIWEIELTLANRDQMGFRMLLGRQALRERFLVDAGNSYYDEARKPQRRKR